MITVPEFCVTHNHDNLPPPSTSLLPFHHQPSTQRVLFAIKPHPFKTQRHLTATQLLKTNSHPIEMAAQPSLSTADVESLLEPLKKAAAQLNNVVAEGQFVLKHHNVFMNQVQSYLERQNSPFEQRHNDKNVTPLLYRLGNYNASLELADYRLALQDKGLRALIQQQLDNLHRLGAGLDGHPYHSPLLYGAANEKPIFGLFGDQLNCDSTPYDPADEQMVSCERKHCPNGSALPKPEETIIPNNEGCVHTNGHGPCYNRHNLISDFETKSFLDTYHDPQYLPSRRGLDRGLDTCYNDVESLGPQPTHGPKARQDNIYDIDLAMANHRDPEKVNVREPWYQPTNRPALDGSKDHKIGIFPREAQASQTLEPRSTRQLAPPEFPDVLQATTAAEIRCLGSLARAHNRCDTKKRRLEQIRAQLREQQAATQGNFKRKADHLAGPPRPARNPFNNDLEQLPHHRHEAPFRPHEKDTMRLFTARKDDFDYPTLPGHLVQHVDNLKRSRSSDTVFARGVISHSLRRQLLAQAPVTDAKGSDTTHHKSGVRAFTDTNNHDEHTTSLSHFSSDSSDSSESGYDTPDFDESSGAGDEDKDKAEGLGWDDAEWWRWDGVNYD